MWEIAALNATSMIARPSALTIRRTRVHTRHLQHRFFTTQRLSPANPLPTSPEHSVYISTSTDPFFNLSYEDWLFKNKNTDAPLLFLYRDAPCVVIGRNQNPWKEVNFAALRARPDVRLVRRRSGGGSVYHDLGNTNFSIHLPREAFDRERTSQIISRALCSLGIDAHVNERRDICVGPYKMSSAYKIVRKRAYHHGTMLISTRLQDLGDLLTNDNKTMITQGVASVRSPVCNLQQSHADVSHDAFVSAVVQEFRLEYGIQEQECTVHDTDNIRNIEHIRRSMTELPSWEWIYGQTPGFTYTVATSFPWGDITAEIRSKHGVILECALKLANHSNVTTTSCLDELAKSLVGQPYGHLEGRDHIIPATKLEVEVKEWLESVMT